MERRKERLVEAIDKMKERYEDVIDLTHFEKHDMALELKGSLVTDWKNGKIYCSLSKRANEEVFFYLIDKLNEIAEKQGSSKRLRGVVFHSVDSNGEEIYHTDCMMTLLSKHAVVCLDAIPDQKEKENLIYELTSSKYNVEPKQILSLNHYESENMCANMFDVLDDNDNHCVVLSQRAFECYR